MHRTARRAFTLVEILIVVVILGILAAVVVPQFARATQDAQGVATLDQLTKLRRALAVYYVRCNAMYPGVSAGSGTWGELLSGGYMKVAPMNNWVGGPNAGVITLGNGPDTGYHQNYGWIYDAPTGSVWAAGFDGDDEPYPRP